MGGRLESVTLAFELTAYFWRDVHLMFLDRLDGWGSVFDVGYELSILACEKG